MKLINIKIIIAWLHMPVQDLHAHIYLHVYVCTSISGYVLYVLMY